MESCPGTLPLIGDGFGFLLFQACLNPGIHPRATGPGSRAAPLTSIAQEKPYDFLLITSFSSWYLLLICFMGRNSNYNEKN